MAYDGTSMNQPAWFTTGVACKLIACGTPLIPHTPSHSCWSQISACNQEAMISTQMYAWYKNVLHLLSRIGRLPKTGPVILRFQTFSKE